MSLRNLIGELDVHGDPPLTQVEIHELAQIHPDGREAFHKRVKRDWYMKITVVTIFLYAVEYLIFSLDVLWVYLVPVMPVLALAHRLKYDRQTNYGALAAAKLAQPVDWPTWKRNTDMQIEREKIKETVNWEGEKI